MTTRIYAPFSPIRGEIHATGDHYWLCEKHKRVDDLIPYFEHPKATMTWACPECIEDHLGKPLLLALGKIECARCKSKELVEPCDICGDFVCSKHMAEGSCDECWEGIRAYKGTGF